uniref:WGS project CBMI000000000 data, contig CS3069_c004023 n=1 Tax=Fusarium clavum TaxID=2594811 RepID=A0A090MEC4_9HYPO|nr:unnamed protein product [Fusarium clavum]
MKRAIIISKWPLDWCMESTFGQLSTPISSHLSMIFGYIVFRAKFVISQDWNSGGARVIT